MSSISTPIELVQLDNGLWYNTAYDANRQIDYSYRGLDSKSRRNQVLGMINGMRNLETHVVGRGLPRMTLRQLVVLGFTSTSDILNPKNKEVLMKIFTLGEVEEIVAKVKAYLQK